MPSARHELGRALKLKASALGPPGQRHFRLQVEAEGGHATFWLEKEQLFNLALAAKRLLAVTSQEERPSEQGPPSEEGGALDLDFKVARLLLAQEGQAGLFLLAFHDMEEAASDETPTASVRATAEQLQSLADEALEVCAAGRPQCPLCGAPMDPGSHACVRSNGHFARQGS